MRRRAADMSPYLQVRDGVAYPPTMLLHGTADTVVPYRQSVKMRDEAVLNTAWTRGWCWSTAQNTSTTSGARRCSI